MKFLSRSWVPLLFGVVVGLVAGLALQQAHTPKYTSSTVVLVLDAGPSTTTSVAGAGTTAKVNLDTESNLVKSTAVLSEARSLIKSTDPLPTIAGRISVSVPLHSAVLRIIYEARSPASTQAGSKAVAAAYLKNREDTAKSLLAAQVKLLRSTYNNTNKALTRATADVLKDKSDSHDGRLAAARKALLTKKTAALRKQLATDQRIDISPGIVVQAASRPTQPAGMSKALLLMSGLTAGILPGLLAAWVLARRPTRTAKT